MNHRKKGPLCIGTAGLLIVLAACSTADGSRVLAPEAPSLGLQGGDKLAADMDTTSGYILVGPQGGNWVFGDHKINFPAGSVCDMSRTSYLDWGKPCTPITTTIRIDVRWWRRADGHPEVDFSPALRFQPTKKGEVTLYLKDAEAARAANPRINYCATAGGACVDESIFDPALVTKRDSRGGFVYRIIRHFSGYNVWA